MNSYHRIYNNDSSNMSDIPDNTVDLVVTSPPYPMIEMWDELFCKDKEVKEAFNQENGRQAFELIHKNLDKVWAELSRVVKNGGFVCINIGDATRTINGSFEIYMNHSRIISAMNALDFQSLPSILWRKQTNAPNKFMGSGMLPAGAYVTLEHEYILIFRKGNKREFKTKEEKLKRQQSAYFWEERNCWFSDLWDFKGTKQNLGDGRSSRTRSAAFPFELAYRLVNMYSVKGDTVLDPFLGTGTTSIAALSSGRNSIGYEIEEDLIDGIGKNICGSMETANARIVSRIREHQKFIREYKKPIKHFNKNINMQVITGQEENIRFETVSKIDKVDKTNFECHYEDYNNEETSQLTFINI